MTREETINLLMMVQASFPNYKVQDKTIAVNTWYTMLKDFKYQHLEMALRAYIMTDTTGFAPSIGQLISKLHSIAVPEELNEMEAWNLVRKAIGNGVYRAEEEFSKLPPLVQKAVGQAGQLREWAKTDLNSIETVVQSNFQRTYRSTLIRQKEIKKMPNDIKALIDRVNHNSTKAQIEQKNSQTIKSLNTKEKTSEIEKFEEQKPSDGRIYASLDNLKRELGSSTPYINDTI